MMCFRLIPTMLLVAAGLLMGSVSSVPLDVPAALTALTTDRVITCDTDLYVQRLSCETGVIVVQSALYGRMDSETCSEGKPASQLSNTTCSMPGFLDVLKKKCDGRRECEISTTFVRSSDPCYGTFKYIDTTFACFPARQRIACESSILDLHCGAGQVLFIYSADFGRNDMRCSADRPASQLQNTQCSRGSNLVAQRCNGKSGCTIEASTKEFGDPCFGTYKYLSLMYTCYYAVFSQK